MEITEVKVIPKEGPDKKLKAYATLTFDNCFVIRNVKVIKGNKGLFVAMPSRKMRESCPKCNYKNAIRSKFCNQCGSNLPVRQPGFQTSQGQGHMGEEPRQSEHRDIAHPITLECREYIQKRVLDTYNAELKRTGLPQSAPEPERTEVPVASSKPVEEKKPKEEPEPVEDSGDIAL